MYRKIVAFLIGAVTTALITAIVTHLWANYVPQGEEDDKRALEAHQKELVAALREISSRLSELQLVPTAVTDEDSISGSETTVKEINHGKIKIAHDGLTFYRKAYFTRVKLYKTRLYIEGLEDSGIPQSAVEYIEWDYKTGRARKNISDSLYLKTINTTITVRAKIFVNANFATENSIARPIEIESELVVPPLHNRTEGSD